MTCPACGSERLFFTDYNAGTVRPPWQSEQEPAGQNRITVARAPDGIPSLRVELHKGDVFTGGDGSTANRAEVYARHAVPGNTRPENWPDPVGSIRWYGLSVFVPNEFVFATQSAHWLLCTQWKGYRGGSPALGLEIKLNRFELVSSNGTVRRSLGTIVKGQRTYFVVGARWSPNLDGWVTVLRDGKEVLAPTQQRTMKLVNGAVDPSYLKQGIYRSSAWVNPSLLFLGPTTIGLTKASVAEYLLI